MIDMKFTRVIDIEFRDVSSDSTDCAVEGLTDQTKSIVRLYFQKMNKNWHNPEQCMWLCLICIRVFFFCVLFNVDTGRRLLIHIVQETDTSRYHDYWVPRVTFDSDP